jgi:tRNA modification GTPase
MKLYENTTIVAIATPPGYGGIGVIRLSGEDSLPLLHKLLDSSKPIAFSPHQVSFHHLLHPESQQTIDDALVTYFKAPHSYTGEDVVEISCHGSPVVIREIIRLLISFGAQLAQPGEFTLRAFLNQRIDLSQAEAINDLIHAQTSYQAQLAARQLRGELATQLKPVKDELIEMIVYFESAVEFVEDDLASLDLQRFQSRLDSLRASITQLTSSYQFGRLVRSGFKLALVGRPNVGKSSVFNALLGRDRAIVTPVPGTTRDTLSEVFSIKGIPVELIDTAGIRETEDVVEKLGVARTRSAIADADLVVALIESHQEISSDDLAFLSQVPFNLLVFNKCDLGVVHQRENFSRLAHDAPTIYVSALTGQGIAELSDLIYARLTAGSVAIPEGGIITNERHYQALDKALKAVEKAQHDLRIGFSEEVVLVNIHEALQYLGIITGETLIGDILNQIFSTFCIGK